LLFVLLPFFAPVLCLLHEPDNLHAKRPWRGLTIPLGLVAENLRESHYGAIPVVEGDIAQTLPDGKTPLRLFGLIDEQDLSQAVLPILQRAEMQRVPGSATLNQWPTPAVIMPP
jgi:hypothetical protein